ncbi:MAG: hypothetical protein II193_08365 [Lachnospiraceae bacterium]|nr:hypothetical protein [Lachnospiraceae bacterium]
MKKPMVKALALSMAFTLTLSAPIMAMAGPVADAYDTQIDVDGSKSGSKTGTSTNTSSKPNPEEEKVILAKVIDVVLSKDKLELREGKSAELEATIILDMDAQEGAEPARLSFDELADADFMVLLGDKEVKASDLVKYLKWSVSDEELITVKPNTENNAFATVTAGTVKFGKGDVKVTLDDKYPAITEVSVTKFATWIKAKTGVKAYVKHTMNVADFFESDGNDITYSISSTKYATLKGNKITFKKATPPNDKLVIYATGHNKEAHAENEVVVELGNPVTKLVATPKNVTIDVTSDNLESFAKELKATVTTKDGKATTDEFTWTVKNSAIATVAESATNENKVTPVKAGKTQVTVKATSGKKCTFTVNVVSTLKEIKSVICPEKIYSGQTVSLSSEVYPAISSAKITYKVYADASCTKKTNLATVNGKGQLVANKKNNIGEVYVTAQAKVGKNIIKCKTPVKVTIAKSTVTGITVDKDAVKLNAHKSYPVVATVLGDGATGDMLSWTSNKTAVAEVAASMDTTDNTKSIGKIANKSGKTGKATVKVSAVGIKKTANGKEKTVTYNKNINVTIEQKVTSLVLSKDTLVYGVNTKKPQNVTLSVKTQLPKNAKKENITWTKVSGSDSISLAGVTANKGKVTIGTNAVVGDSAVFQAVATSGAKAYATVYVVDKAKKMTIQASNNAKLSKIETNYVDHKQYVLGKDFKVVALNSAKKDVLASDKIASITSNNKAALVDFDAEAQTCKITAGAKGKATITVKLLSGKTAKFTFIVK